MKVDVNRGGEIIEVYPRHLTTSELCRELQDISIDTSECWMPETAGNRGRAAINEAIRRIKESAAKEKAAKTLPKIIQDMRQHYEANQGYPTSAAPFLTYANQLDALVRCLFPVKNANSYGNANEAFRTWKQTHEAPKNAKLPQWVKDFVNWLMEAPEARP